MEAHPVESTLSWRAMATLARLCDRVAVHIVVISTLLAVACSLYAWRCLGFDPDRNNLIGPQAAYNQVYLRFKKDFPQDDDIVVIFYGGNPAHNRAALDALAAAVRRQPQYFTDVLDKIDLGFVRSHLLLYLSVDDLRVLENRLKEVAPFVRRMLIHPGIVPLFGSINQEIQAFIKKEVAKALQGGAPTPRDEGEGGPDIAGALPILGRIVSQMDEAVSHKEFVYHSPWGQLFGGNNAAMQDVPEQMYAGEYADGKMYSVSMKQRRDRDGHLVDAEVVLDALNKTIAEIRPGFPDVDIGVTGEPSLEVDEMRASQNDSMHASILSLIAVAVLFFFAFGTLLRPGFAIFALILAMAQTMGFATLAIGHLNILTVTCMPMLIGLGIDFGIQVISRYDEERLNGHAPLEALTQTFGGTGMSIVTAGMTTSVSFLAARFTGFEGIGELGLLASAGLILSLIAMMTVLPALLLMYDKYWMRFERGTGIKPSPLRGLSSMESVLLGHPFAVLALAVILTWMCATRSVAVSTASVHLKVPFDANLEKLQSEGTPSVIWEHQLMSNAGKMIIPALLGASTVDEARALTARIEKLDTVQSVESIAPMFPTDQAEKLKIIPAIQRELAALPPMKTPLPDVDVPALRKIMEQLRGIFFLIFPEVQQSGHFDIANQIRDFVFSADGLLAHTVSGGDEVMRRLNGYQAGFFNDLSDKLKLIKGNGKPIGLLTFDDVPPALRHEMIGRNNKILLRVFPKEYIWDEGANSRFLRSLDNAGLGQTATGTPRQMLESTRLLRTSYERAGEYALVVIVILVLLHFLSGVASLLALLPLALGIVWGLGLMAMMHIAFNPANYMVLPLILGIGVANGIYVVRRFQEEGNAEIFEVSTGRAILLSNLTAMIGFSSLMIAKYTGIRSLGAVMTLGIGTCMVTSLFVLPVLLKFISGRLRI